MKKENIKTMRSLINDSEHEFYTAIAPQNVEAISVTIPERTIAAASKGLLDDQHKLLGWFGLDSSNTVSKYALSINNNQDILNGRLKNTKHFIRSCKAWHEEGIEFCGLMYLQPHGHAALCKGDWFHIIDVLMKYGFSYGFIAVGEMSADKKSVIDIKYYLMDFFGTVYTAEDTGENKVFYKNEKIRENFMSIINTEADAFYESLRLP